MKLLGNRKFVIFITVIIAILSTLFGVGRSLNRLARDVEAMFYNGVYLKDEGYTQPGIDAQLKNRLNSSLAFAVLMEKHPEAKHEAEALLAARNELIAAGGITEKFTANEALQHAFMALALKAEHIEVTEKEKSDIKEYSSTFSGAQTAINGSRYNHEAETFMDDASFFAFVLRPFVFLTPPQVFA